MQRLFTTDCGQKGGVFMRSFGAIGIGFLGLCAFSSAVEAQQCDLNRKTINFNINVCSNRGCTWGAERVDFLGNHIIHYSGGGTGTVYTLGQTVDLCTDQANAALWMPRCNKTDDNVKASATAAYAGSEIRLTIEQAFFKKSMNNMLYSRVIDVMRIGIPDCKTCVLLDNTTMGYGAAGTQALLTMGGTTGCQISDLP